MVSTRFGKKDLKITKRSLSKLNGRLLDIGCGNMIDRIGFSPGDEYIGVDIEKSKYTDMLADIHNLPFKNESFNSCICNAVIEHVIEPEIALKECNRVLKKGGVMWISVPFLQHIHANYDFRRFTGSELANRVRSAGFDVDWIHGNYGIFDSIEYLLYGAFIWKINDALGASDGLGKFLESKTKKREVIPNIASRLFKKEGALGVTYILLIAIFFLLFGFLSILFDSQQENDIHHPVSFNMIAHKL